MHEKYKNEATDQLVKGILTLRDADEAYAFLIDICTINEIESLSQRLEVAKMLKDGYTYEQVAEATGASTATISRVKRYLKYGAGGYRLVLRRMNENGI